jgi:ParB-like chromosome segregation protein Spo0J
MSATQTQAISEIENAAMDDAAISRTEWTEIEQGNAAEEMAEISPEAESKEDAPNEMSKLAIDPEFRTLIQPLTAGELAALTGDIKMHGCRDPLVIWKGRNIILDGHHRYEICKKLGISYQVFELEFPDEIEAKIWLIKNQRGRRNMNESQRALAAVTLEALYSEHARARMGTRTDLGQNLDPSEAGRSAEKAARDMGVSHQTVSFAKKVTTKGIPELAELVRSGEIAVSAAAKAAGLPEEKQQRIVGEIGIQIRDGMNPKIPEIIQGIIGDNDNNCHSDPDERLERFRRNLEANMSLLKDIESASRPENLVEMLAISGKMMAGSVSNLL